ncbi:MAG: PorT family protein [Saprospiraceae bacterium]|nr:PorT family protein [Saprospiraceae bacterium]
MNDFDKKITDKGWKSMRSTLDREMPARRRRRFFAWWWLGLLLLPFAGAGAWWWLRHPEPPAQQPKTPLAIPAVRPPVVEARGSESRPFAPEKNHAPKAEDRVSTDEQHADTESVNKSVSRTAAAGIREGASARNDEKTKGVTPNGIMTNDVMTNDATTVTVPANSKTPGDQLLLPIPGRIPVLGHSSELRLQTVPCAVRTPAVTKKQSSPARWAFGITAGIQSDRFSGLNGFSTGLVADWQIKQKWGIRTGLQYAQYRPSLEERPVVTVSSTEYVNATGDDKVVADIISQPNTGTSSAVQPVPVLVPVDRLQRFEMPLLVYWQPLRPLRIYGGVRGSYSLSAKVSGQNYANNKIYVAQDSEALANLDALAASSLRRWDLDLMLGAGLRIGKRFELDAFFKPGFSKSAADGSDLNYSSGTNGAYDPAVIMPRTVGTQSWFFLNAIMFF